MFSKLIIVSALAVFAAATPTPGGGEGQCNTGTIQCCNQVTKSSQTNGLLGLINAVDVGASVPVSLACSPIASILGGNTCNANTFCCQNNQASGLVTLSCNQINL